MGIRDIETHLEFEKNLSKKISRAVFERDNFMCRNCNSDYGVSPHHIVYRSIERNHSLGNLVLLCSSCHRRIHDGDLVVRRIGDDFFFGNLR